jgi:abequosyltransferase
MGPVLSICIATMNRPEPLAEELATLLPQIEGHPIEVVVLDSSPSPTVASWYSHPQIRVVTSPPHGVDHDFDQVVRLADGKYCWLLSDDDRIRPGAVDTILNALDENPSVVLLNTVAYDPTFTSALNDGHIPRDVPARLDPPVTAADLASLGNLLTFIGSVVVRRSLWVERSTSSLFGYEFIHVGVLLSAPLPEPVVVVHRPQIDVRYGVAQWGPRAARIWDSQWPDLIDKVVADPFTREAFYNGSGWHRAKRVLHYRATGLIGAREVLSFHRHRRYESRGALLVAFAIASFPVLPLNLALSVATATIQPNRRHARLDLSQARRRRMKASALLRRFCR